jgi:hypothetical protein
MITLQAQIIAYIDDFKLMMIVTLAAIPLLIAFKKASGNGGENHALVVERHPAPSVIVTTYQECTFCAENSRQSTSRGEGSLIRNQAT